MLIALISVGENQMAEETNQRKQKGIKGTGAEFTPVNLAFITFETVKMML